MTHTHIILIAKCLQFMELDKLKIPVTKSREIIIVSIIGQGARYFSKKSITIFSYINKAKDSIEKIDNSEKICVFQFILGLLGIYITEKSTHTGTIQPQRLR